MNVMWMWVASADRRVMQGLQWATSTKGAFYALALLIVVANVIKAPTDLQAWILVLVSELYQGCALPGLGAAQKAEADHTRQLLQETHDTVMQELTMAKQERQETKELLREVHSILHYLHTIHTEDEEERHL